MPAMNGHAEKEPLTMSDQTSGPSLARRLLRALPLTRRYFEAIAWRDARITELFHRVLELENMLLAKTQGSHDPLREAIHPPQDTELELYRLRSGLNRAVDRAERERLARLATEAGTAVPSLQRAESLLSC